MTSDLFIDDNDLNVPPFPCEKCETLIFVGDEVIAACPTGECTVLACPNCSAEFGGWGPVECPACGSAPTWSKRFAWWLAGLFRKEGKSL